LQEGGRGKEVAVWGDRIGVMPEREHLEKKQRSVSEIKD